MGHSIRVLPQNHLAVVRLFGELDGDGLLGAVGALLLAPGWRRAFDAVWDARGVRVLDLCPEDVERFAAGAAALRGRACPSRSAVLVRGEDDEVTLRLLARRGRGPSVREVRAFYTARQAAAWLGVPEGALGEATAPTARGPEADGGRRPNASGSALCGPRPSCCTMEPHPLPKGCISS